MAKAKSFEVTARISILVSVPVKAATWEDAVVAAKALKVGDFLELPNGHIDNDGVKICSIYDLGFS